MITMFYLRDALFIDPCYVYAEINPDNNYFDPYGKDMKDNTLRLRKTTIPKQGLPTMLANLS